MAAELPPKLQDVMDSLSLLTDRSERIEALVSIAERFRPAPPGISNAADREAHRVPACESEAFVWATPLDRSRVDLHYAADNPQGVSAMALCSILDDALSGEMPDEIAKVPDDLIYEIFGRELSMGKSMGLMGVIQMTKTMAKRAAQ